MKIRVESFIGNTEPSTCEDVIKHYDLMQKALREKYPHEQTKWWINIYLQDNDVEILLCQRYWEDGMEKDIVMI